MPAVGFHDAVDILAHGEAGAHPDDEGRVRDAHAYIAFGKSGLNDDFGAQVGDGDAVGIDEHGDAAGIPQRGDFVGRGGQRRGNALNGAESFIDGFGEGHAAAHGQRPGRFQNDQPPESRAVEPERNACGDVSAPAEKNGEPLILVHACVSCCR